MFGYSDVELLNRQFSGFCEDSLELTELFRKINENFSIRHYEIHFRSKNDQFIPVGFSFSRLVDKDAIFSGYLCTGKDLSEIKRLEEQLLEKERLATLMETAATINHEINNPLTPILGNIQLILARQTNIDPWLLNKLKLREKNAWRVHQVVQKLRSITQPVSTDYFGDINMIDIDKSE